MISRRLRGGARLGMLAVIALGISFLTVLSAGQIGSATGHATSRADSGVAAPLDYIWT